MTFVVTQACIRCKYTDCVDFFLGSCRHASWTQCARKFVLNGADWQASGIARAMGAR